MNIFNMRHASVRPAQQRRSAHYSHHSVWCPASVAILMLTSFVFGLIPVYGDGIGYHFLFQQLRAGNWSLTRQFDSPPHAEDYMFVPARGEWSTFYQIGTPIMWVLAVPFFHVPRALLTRLTTLHPELPYTFTYLRDGLFILTLTSLLASATLWLMARFAIRSLGTTPTIAWAGATAAFFGLPTWYYTFFGSSYSHIVELFILTLALLIWWRSYQRVSYPLLMVSSVLFGCAALVRFDALLFVLPIGILSIRRFRCIWRAAVAWSPVIFLSAAQFILWHSVFGAWFPPQRYTLGEFTFPAAHAYETLFSGLRGFFVWSPIAAIGVIGLIGSFKNARYHIISLLGVSILLLYALFYGSWKVWWGGIAFGQRFLIPLFPFIAIGVVCFLEELRDFPRWIRGFGRALIVGILVYNIILGAFHLHVSRTYPNTEYYAPWQIFSPVYREYGFINRSSFAPLFQSMFWHGPRVIHLFLP